MRVFGLALAGLLTFGQLASAGTLRYELKIPPLQLVSGSVSYGSEPKVVFTAEELIAENGADAFAYYGNYFSSIFIEFEIDTLPFSLRNSELIVNKSGSVTVYDISGPTRETFFETDLGYEFERKITADSWITGLTTANASNDYFLRFDENGDIFDWRVGLDDDKPDFVSTTDSNTVYLYAPDSLFDGYPYAPDIFSDITWSSPQTQSWTRTGTLPLAPAAVPLPASGVLLLAAFALTAATRRRKTH